MSPPVELPTPGLRERKKERTRETIRARALHLFVTQGYQATTVQQIIDDVEISESTFFRYFPTKGDVVLTDDFDPIIVAAFLRQPRELGPIEALRRAFNETFGELTAEQLVEQQDRMHLILSVPELRASMLDQFGQAMRLLASAIAERTQRRPDDMEVLTIAGAVVGVAMAVMFVMIDDPTADLHVLLDQGMARLQAGLGV
ncbi:MAG: TetR family transcriptional regulator [Candidatus Dormibacteria bacterium]